MEAGWFFGIGTIAATLLGPIFAVQVQKFLERRGETRNEKMWVFRNLMATRGVTLAPEHVRALNMIDLAFNGGKSNQRKKTENDVLDAWKEYLAHLNTPYNEVNFERWAEKKQELFVGLLGSMATDLDLRYDRVLLRDGAYMPKGYADLENDQYLLRKLTIKVLSGEQPVSMKITDFPVNEDLLVSQQKLQEALTRTLSDQGQLNVRVQRSAGTDKRENGAAQS